MHAYGADGRLLHTFGPERVHLPPRVASPQARSSESVSFTLDLASLPVECSSLETIVLDTERETLVASRKLLA